MLWQLVWYMPHTYTCCGTLCVVLLDCHSCHACCGTLCGICHTRAHTHIHTHTPTRTITHISGTVWVCFSDWHTHIMAHCMISCHTHTQTLSEPPHILWHSVWYKHTHTDTVTAAIHAVAHCVQNCLPHTHTAIAATNMLWRSACGIACHSYHTHVAAYRVVMLCTATTDTHTHAQTATTATWNMRCKIYAYADSNILWAPHATEVRILRMYHIWLDILATTRGVSDVDSILIHTHILHFYKYLYMYLNAHTLQTYRQFFVCVHDDFTRLQIQTLYVYNRILHAFIQILHAFTHNLHFTRFHTYFTRFQSHFILHTQPFQHVSKLWSERGSVSLHIMSAMTSKDNYLWCVEISEVIYPGRTRGEKFPNLVRKD